jgi:hypothetical protein
MQNEQVLPCPFCGELPHPSDLEAKVVCKNNHCYMSGFTWMSVDIWNNRPHEKMIQEKLKQSDSIIDSIKSLTGFENLDGEKLLNAIHILKKDNSNAWSALEQVICTLKGSNPRDVNYHIEAVELAEGVKNRLKGYERFRPSKTKMGIDTAQD